MLNRLNLLFKKIKTALVSTRFVKIFYWNRNIIKQSESARINRLLKHVVNAQVKKARLNLNNIEIEGHFITQQGLLVFFHCRQNNHINAYTHLLEISALNHSLWKRPKIISSVGLVKEGWKFLKLTQTDYAYEANWHSPTIGYKIISYPKYILKPEFKHKNQVKKLEKPKANPLIAPSKNEWEAFCTFNPAAVQADDKVHILYRAQGHDYVSQIGYAISNDGIKIDQRFNKPIYRPTQKFEGINQPINNPYNHYPSGNGCGGCEDPRATIIDERLYMTYVAYDGANPPRIALTSIAMKDFLKKKFAWKKPVLISPPGVVDKSAVIFPEKINGKYAIMHRIFPDILIDYVDTLDFNGETFLEAKARISPRSAQWWDSRKIGAGAPPLKTKDGWLLIYQAVDDKDASQYKVGAMLLDLNDPSKVIARSSAPILEPVESYENHGFKAGVVYPCGAVIKNDQLLVYYGGADSFVCVASTPLDEFLENLKLTGRTQITSQDIIDDQNRQSRKNTKHYSKYDYHSLNNHTTYSNHIDDTNYINHNKHINNTHYN